MTTAPTAVRRTTGADRLRWVLLLAWLVVAVGALGLGERPSSRAALDEGLAAGRVAEVGVVGGIPQYGRGEAVQEVHWRDGPVRRWYAVRQVSPGVAASRADLPSSTREVGDELAQAHPGLRVERLPLPYVRSTLRGWIVPGPVVWLTLVTSLLSLLLVVNGPEPWRATRWAWFWLLSTPAGAVAFLLLSGPTPRLPAPRDPARRLSGLRGLLLAYVLVAVVRWL